MARCDPCSPSTSAEVTVADLAERFMRVHVKVNCNANVVSSVLNRTVANDRCGAFRAVRFGMEKPRPAAATAAGSGGGEL